MDIKKEIEESYLSINPSGFYVYFLINPINNRVFYVGKGIGKRAWQHLNMKGSNINKINTIKEIYNNGLSPIIKIHSENLIEEDAYNTEMAFIQALNGLTNISIPKKERLYSGVYESVNYEVTKTIDADIKALKDEIKNSQLLFENMYLSKDNRLISIDNQTLSLLKK